eukprot:SAG22_NODE_1415_length_4470_cov_28.138412_3_plen_100_part_00
MRFHAGPDEIARAAGLTPLMGNAQPVPPRLQGVAIGAEQSGEPQSVAEWLAQWAPPPTTGGVAAQGTETNPLARLAGESVREEVHASADLSPLPFMDFF